MYFLAPLWGVLMAFLHYYCCLYWVACGGVDVVVLWWCGSVWLWCGSNDCGGGGNFFSSFGLTRFFSSSHSLHYFPFTLPVTLFPSPYFPHPISLNHLSSPFYPSLFSFHLFPSLPITLFPSPFSPHTHRYHGNKWHHSSPCFPLSDGGKGEWVAFNGLSVAKVHYSYPFFHLN